MHSPFLPVESGLDIQKQAKRLGVSFWYTPTFLFIALGVAVAFLMVSVYLSFSYSENIEVVVILESGIAMFFLLFGGFIIQLFEEIAISRKLKSDFISIISHKLKSPSAQIKWYIDSWKEKNAGGDHDQDIETIRKIELANDRLIRMVEEFLVVSRFESGDIQWHEDRVNISVLVDEICGRFRVDAEKKGVQMKLEVFGENGDIEGDRKKIIIALENILLNALQYTHRSGIVTISVFNRDQEIEVNIKDTGIGIPKEYQGQVFEKFFRADNAVLLNTEGAGLGLFVCKKIIVHMGGKIKFQSQEKQGSSFSLIFRK